MFPRRLSKSVKKMYAKIKHNFNICLIQFCNKLNFSCTLVYTLPAMCRCGGLRWMCALPSESWWHKPGHKHAQRPTTKCTRIRCKNYEMMWICCNILSTTAETHFALLSLLINLTTISSSFGLKAQCDVFKFLLLSDWQSETQRYSLYSHMRQKKEQILTRQGGTR